MKKNFLHTKKSAKRLLSFVLCLTLLIPMGASGADFSPRTTAPGSSNTYYYGGSNPFTIGQCTWYAYGRVYEMTGKKPKISSGNAGTWWSQNVKNGYYDYGTEPALGAIACYTSDPGHVAIVEKIENGIAYVSEGNISGRNFSYGRSATGRSDFKGYIYVCGKPQSSGGTTGDSDSTVVVNFTDYASSLISSQYSVTNTNAVLVTTVTKTAGASVSSAGIYFYDATGKQLGTCTISTDVTKDATTFNLSCNVNSALGLTLTPSTTYKYSFYVVIQSKTYASSPVSFTTAEPNKYTVTYDANGGKNPPASQTKTQFTPLTLTTDIPTYEGYVFAGWAESSTAQKATYQAGTTYTEEASKTLYAVWEKLNITGISLNKSRVSLLTGTTVALTAELLPAGAVQNVSWESTNPYCAMVSTDGIVTAFEEGKTIIFARAGSYTATCTVEVFNEAVEIQSITLAEDTLEVKKDATATVNYVVAPLGASNVDISWYSSNDDVATVTNDGVITGVRKGTCKIYCIDNNSYVSGCVEVTVTQSRFSSVLKIFTLAAKAGVVFLKLFGQIFEKLLDTMTKAE